VFYYYSSLLSIKEDGLKTERANEKQAGTGKEKGTSCLLLARFLA